MLKKETRKNSVPASFKHICTYHGVEEYELKKNGLRMLYHHDDTASVVGVMVTYLVGSRYEATGYTGSTHILEHMMFKGSKKFPLKKNENVLSVLEKKGFSINATTWLDRTNYYEVFPDEHFEYALELESDRMRNAFIRQKDLDEELPAVISEYMMHENDPVENLDALMWAMAFLAHPYHNSTIGWLSDIENASVERLKKFYDTYYHPNNAVLTIIGNIERDTALSLVKKHFGVYKKSEKEIPMPNIKEPEQIGKRFVEIKKEGTKNIIAVAFKVPEALSVDTAGVTVLSSLLGGGKTSRLYKALVDKGLASSVHVDYMPFYDKSIATVFVTLSDNVKHEKVEALILKEFKKIIENGISENELKRVLASVSTEIAFSRDGHYAMLSSLNEAISAGDWKLFFNFPKKIKKLKMKDVQNIAKKYLLEEKMTIGYYRAK